MGINWIITQLSTEKTATIVTNIIFVYGDVVEETAEKVVQDTSCRGSGGVPQLQKPPKIGGYMELIETISAVS